MVIFPRRKENSLLQASDVRQEIMKSSGMEFKSKGLAFSLFFILNSNFMIVNMIIIKKLNNH